MGDLDSINAEQRLYVLKAGKGYSCLGFDVADKWAKGISAWLPEYERSQGLTVTEIPGTPEHFAKYSAIMRAGYRHNVATGARCEIELIPELKGKEGKRVEVTTPSGEVSRFYVGKSTGWMPCHLEIKTRRSRGGGSAYVPTGSIVRVIGTR